MTLFICPIHGDECEGVTLDLGKFADTTATVGPCDVSREDGVISYTIRKSAGLALVRKGA